MDKLQFYKEIYFKESDLKHKLDDKVTVPIAMLTFIVSIHTYIYSSSISGFPLTVIKYSSFFTLIFMVIALFYLGRSFMNLGKTHVYREIASMNKYLEYDSKLREHDRVQEYEEHLEKEFAACASHNRDINIGRTQDLAKSKKYIFICLLLSFFNTLCYITSISIR